MALFSGVISKMYQDKWILVTGSSRGVGKLISEHLLRNGASVVGFARGKASIEHPKYFHMQIDIGDIQSIKGGFSRIRKLTNKLDVLVNNAAIATSQYVMIASAGAMQEMLNVNLLGTFLVSGEAAKLMYKNNHGRIINIGSMMSKLQPAGGAVYAACKAALNTFSIILAKELASYKVTSNTLAISALHTDMANQLSSEVLHQTISTLTFPRFAEPDDIFNVLDFFASERSSYITGQTIYLGGVS